MQDWRDRLKERMEELGMTAAELTRAAGVNPSMVHDILNRGSTPSVVNLRRIANAVGMSLGELLEGHRPDPVSYPIIATITSDGPSTALTDDPSTGSINIDGGQVVGVTIEGDGLRPFYSDGDVVLGPRQPRSAFDKFLGKECIIATDDGSIYLRYLKRGRAFGRYNLGSHFGYEGDIEDAKVDWIAKITVIQRAG